MPRKSKGSTGVEHPNAATIAGLRECADWLEQHPELPERYYASVSFGYDLFDGTARKRLTMLAKALGDRANEMKIGGRVEISGTFGGRRGVVVVGSAKTAALVDALPVPEPEPIIAVEPERAA